MLGVRVSFLSNSLIYAIHPIEAKKGELLGVSKQVCGSIWDLSIPDLLQFLYPEVAVNRRTTEHSWVELPTPEYSGIGSQVIPNPEHNISIPEHNIFSPINSKY